MATRILLARHGGTIWSSDNRFAGSTDVDLSDEGRAQTTALGKRLATETIHAAYCSPMKRAVETATLALNGRDLPLTRLPSLMEINHGPWEGLRQSEAEEKYPDDYAAWGGGPVYVPTTGR